MQDKTLDKVLRTTTRHLGRLELLGVKTVKDFLLYFPRTYNDTREFTKISEIRTDKPNTIKGQLTSLFNIRTRHGKKITRGVFTDGTGSMGVVWFNQPHLTRMLPRKSEIILSGNVKFAFGRITLQNPSYELIKKHEEQIHSGRIVPVYHETEGISSKWLREKLKPLIDYWLELLNEYLPQEIIKEHDLMDYKEAIKNVHFPDDPKLLKKAKFRLAFDELFILQLKVLQKRWRWQNIKNEEKKEVKTKTKALKQCIQSLSFTLTNAQKRTVKEILEDLKKPFPMSRLIQGDVGS